MEAYLPESPTGLVEVPENPCHYLYGHSVLLSAKPSDRKVLQLFTTDKLLGVEQGDVTRDRNMGPLLDTRVTKAMTTGSTGVAIV